MSINITDKPEINVVNVGDEISSAELAAITNAADPTSENPFATMADVGGGGGGSYLPLAGGTMTGDILFGTASQYIGEGNFDTSRGGVNGLSLVCSVGYEFNWQAGWLTTTEQNSTTPRSLYLDGEAGTTLRVWNNTSNSGTHISTSELIFGTTVVEDNATWANTTVNSNGIAWTDFEAYQAGGYNKLGFELWFNGANNPTFITASLDSAGSNDPNIQLQPDYGASPSGSPVPMKIDGFGLTFPDGSYQTSATFGTGDQTVNTTDEVVFQKVDVLDSTAPTYTSYISNDEVKVEHDAGGGGLMEHSLVNSSGLNHYSSPDGGSTNNTVLLNTTGLVFSGTAFTGIVFPDTSVLTTAPVAFDQALNTSDSPNFVGVSTNGLTLTNVGSAGTGITFHDSTTQTSAPVYSASTVLTGGTGSNLKSDDYPHEIRIDIGGVTYAMPARIV
jgi:hypothetical protein